MPELLVDNYKYHKSERFKTGLLQMALTHMDCSGYKAGYRLNNIYLRPKVTLHFSVPSISILIQKQIKYCNEFPILSLA